jgi:adhesin transport system outer membrane protein
MNRTYTAIWVALVSFGMASAAPSVATAEGLADLIPNLLATHDLVKASEADLDASRQRTRETRGRWFPQLNIISQYGHEWIDKTPGQADTNQVNRELDASVTQLLWDGGAANAAIRNSELNKVIDEQELESARQDLALEAIIAFMNVVRTREILGFAIESEENIKKQAEVEDALVQRGGGLSTNVLQAKRDLAQAENRRVEAETALLVARNNFRRIFGTDVANVETLEKPRLPTDQLPNSIEEAVRVAITENPKLAAAHSVTLVRREQAKAARATGFFPRFDAIAEHRIRKDDDGLVGAREETVAKIQMNFPFNLGLTSINTLNAAESDTVAAGHRAADQRDRVEEATRNAWDNLEAARLKFSILTNQTNLAAEFLELARRERQLGNRSLLDVLAGETELINAISDAAAAEADVAIQVYTLLNAMGRLTENMIVNGS